MKRSEPVNQIERDTWVAVSEAVPDNDRVVVGINIHEDEQYHRRVRYTAGDFRTEGSSFVFARTITHWREFDASDSA